MTARSTALRETEVVPTAAGVRDARSACRPGVDPTTKSRAVPIYQTTSYVFNSPDHAASLFGLQGVRQHLHPDHEPDHGRLRKARRRAGGRRRRAGHRLRPGGARRWRSSTSPAPATRSSPTTSLYGGTYNLFAHTLPKMGIKVKFVEPNAGRRRGGDHAQDEGGLLRDDRQPRSADPRHRGGRRRSRTTPACR